VEAQRLLVRVPDVGDDLPLAIRLLLPGGDAETIELFGSALWLVPASERAGISSTPPLFVAFGMIALEVASLQCRGFDT
jgi:hypothetical protein